MVVFYSFMDSHKDMNVNKFRIPTIKHFFKAVRFETFKGGKLCSLFMVNAEKWGAKIKQ